MRFLTTLVLGICVSCMVLAQDEAKKPAATKEIAKSVWDKLNAGPSSVFESNKIILMMPKTAEPKAKDITSNLEKYYENAAKSVGYKEDNAPWNGKLMVFIMPEREQFVAFVRRVENARPAVMIMALLVLLRAYPTWFLVQPSPKILQVRKCKRIKRWAEPCFVPRLEKNTIA